MVATPKLIQELRIKNRMHIDPELEELILREYGEEPHPHVWTDQDLFEQVRKLVMKHNSGQRS